MAARVAAWFVVAARLRRAGAGALQRPPRTLPAAVRRGQYAGRQPHDAGALFPHPAPPASSRDFRKPLIVMTPKSLLRHKRAVSRLDEMGPNTSFHRLLWDDAQMLPDEKIKLVPDDKMRRVVICSGKVYYDLYEEREKRGRSTTFYLLRIEQLYPFPDQGADAWSSRASSRPRSCGARKSRAIWAAGCSSISSSNGCSTRSAPNTAARATPGARRRPRPRSGRCRCISRELKQFLEDALA